MSQSTDRERAARWLSDLFEPPPAPKPVASSLSTDTERARAWLVEIGLVLLYEADKYNKRETALLDKVSVVAACAELPGDMPLRIRCTPHVFVLKA